MCDAPAPTPVCHIPCEPCVTDPISVCSTNFGVLGHIPGTACTAGLALVLEPGSYGGRVLKAIPVTAETAVPAVVRFACGSGTNSPADLIIQPAHAVDAEPEPPFGPLWWWIPGAGHSGGDGKYYAFISTERPGPGFYAIAGQKFYPWTTDGDLSVTNCWTYPFKIATVGVVNAPFLPTSNLSLQQNLVVVKNDGQAFALQLELYTVVVAPYLAVPPVATTQVASVDDLDLPVPRGLGPVAGTVFSPFGTRVVEVVEPVLA